jgi:3-methylcrotonyl-CoA carboxylase alpha subunit
MAEPAVAPIGGGRYLVEAEGTRRLAYAVRQGSSVWVFLDGLVTIIDDERQRGHPTAADDDAGLTAPMPARVLRITAEVGQQVAKGDVLLTLEAMKMELPVRAPRDGVVKAISCQTERMVSAGDRLVELE